MKRHVVRVMVCVVVGVVVNVLVAWGCWWGHVASAPVMRAIGVGTLPVDESWPVVVPGDWPSGWRDFQRVTSVGTRSSFLAVSREHAESSVRKLGVRVSADGIPQWDEVTSGGGGFRGSSLSTQYSVSEFAAGWPALAVASYGWETADVMSDGSCGRRTNVCTDAPTVRWGIDVAGLLGGRWPASWISELLLPLRPVWPGFAIDVAVYGVVAWMVLFVPGDVRRAMRERRRGRCVTCGYELAGLASGAVCPECGGEVESKAPGESQKG